MLNSFKLDEEEIRRITTGIAGKGTSITTKLRQIDSIIKEAVSEVNSLAEVPDLGYESLEGSIREIESLTNKIRGFGGIAEEYYSEVDKEFFKGQEKVTNDLSNLVLNDIYIYDDLNLKSKVQSYGMYGSGTIQRQLISLSDILNESSVNNALKDSYEKNLEEIRQLTEFAELDIETLLEGYTEEDRQKLRDAQNQIKEYLKAVDADELMSITYEKDLERFLTSDKMNYVTRGERAVSTVLDFVPVVGNVKGLAEAITGQNFITGEELSTGERVLTGIFSCLGLGAEGALVKNVGKAAVKDGLKGAVKFGGKEALKDMSKNAAFYGGSVALSEAGIDQKYQLGFMAAVTVVGHGKTAMAGIDNIAARTKGISKGGFLDTLRVQDKFTYKEAMSNLRDLTRDRRIVLNSNGVGEIDKIINSSKNLRDIVKKIDRIDLSGADKRALSKLLAYGDKELINDAIKAIGKNDKSGIVKLISGLGNDKNIAKMEDDWLFGTFLDMISAEKGAVKNEAVKEYVSDFHKEVGKFFEGDFKKNIIDVYADKYRKDLDINKCLKLKEDDEFFEMLNITEESEKTLQGINNGNYSYVRKGAKNPVKTAVHEQMHIQEHILGMIFRYWLKNLKKLWGKVNGRGFQMPVIKVII